MKIKTVREAVISVLRKMYPDFKIYGADTREPVTRPSMKVVLISAGCGAMCEGARERSVDVDIYYFAADESNARAELEEAEENLGNAFYGGFAAGGVWLYPDWDISMERTEDDILVCQFGVTWYETERATGEPMEDLELSFDVDHNMMEVLHDGSDDAEG